MTSFVTVVVDTNGQDTQATIDALRAENILATTLELAYKDQLFVNAGFAHPDGVDIMSRFDEVDTLIRSVLAKAGIDGEIRGHGLSDGTEFGAP